MRSAAAPESAYRGRFAPSPTGPLHLGSLLAALASWLDARHHHGVWLLRIEDVDPYRSDPHAAQSFPRTLEKFGLLWDESIVHQCQRLERYREILACLDGRGLIYACDCSRKQLAEEGHTGERYPNRCRRRGVSRHTPHALRLITEDRPIQFVDRLQGPFSVNLEREVGDFIVYRRDQAYAYHLAVVVDDHDQRVNHVVRGVDLLESTPRHLYLQQLLGWSSPDYLHLPVILAADGQKLSKQTGALPVDGLEPSVTLERLLALLQHSPPSDLHGAPPAELLVWAAAHWNPAAIIRQKGLAWPSLASGAAAATSPARDSGVES